MNENARLSRRDFLRAGAVAGGATALGGLVAIGADLRPTVARAQSLRIRSAAVTPSVCPYCSVGCGTLVHTVDGKIVNIEGDPRRRPARGAHRPRPPAAHAALMAPSRARAMRPAKVCAAPLAALDASEGRSRSRKRDQTPDRVGLGIKRGLLERAVRDDPSADASEGWLLERCLAGAGVTGVGPVRAMAQEVLLEWRLAQRPGAFRRWLVRGAPSDDARPCRP